MNLTNHSLFSFGAAFLAGLFRRRSVAEAASSALQPPKARAELDKPLRSEILTREGLAEHAHVLAEQHRTAPSRRGTRALYRRFEDNCKVIEKSYLSLSRAVQDQETLTSGAEWLLDNYHLVVEQVHDIQRNFPHGYYRSLPKLVEGEYKNYPRVYHLALE